MTMVSQQEIQYKSDILSRLGGDNMFAFIVIMFVDFIQVDPELQKFFGKFTPQDLVVHQTEFLKTIFREHRADFDVSGHILLRNYDLVERGFRDKHYDLMVNKHFVRALEGSWIDKDTIADAVGLLSPFRSIFERKQEKSKRSLRQKATGLFARAGSGKFCLSEIMIPKIIKISMQEAH